MHHRVVVTVGTKKKLLSLAEIMAEEEAEQRRKEAEEDEYRRAMEASQVDVDHELEAAIALSLQEEEQNGDERAQVEQALRLADIEQEEESYRLAMRLQAEEERLSVPTHRQKQGNVRIMTKQQIFLESKAHELKTTGPGGITLLGDRDDDDDDGGGFRMNSSRGTSDAWVRLDQNVIMGPNQELRTKHDIALNNQANAHRLGLEGSSGISNQTYNDFREKAKRRTQQHQKQQAKRATTNKPTDGSSSAGRSTTTVGAQSTQGEEREGIEIPSVEEEAEVEEVADSKPQHATTTTTTTTTSVVEST